MGAVLWLGVAIPTPVHHGAFAVFQPIVMMIDAANVLVAYRIDGMILAAWRRM
jgi:hypothetical protein